LQCSSANGLMQTSDPNRVRISSPERIMENPCQNLKGTKGDEPSTTSGELAQSIHPPRGTSLALPGVSWKKFCLSLEIVSLIFLRGSHPQLPEPTLASNWPIRGAGACLLGDISRSSWYADWHADSTGLSKVAPLVCPTPSVIPSRSMHQRQA